MNNKEEIEETIQEYLNDRNDNIVSIETENLPTYTFAFIDKEIQTNEEEVLIAVKDQSIVTYRSYAIKLDGEEKETVKTIEEAENVVNQMKDEYGEDFNFEFSIEEKYTKDNPNDEFVEAEIATASLDGIVNSKIEEIKLANSEAVINGIYLTRPLSSGMVTSRFGSRSSIRSGAHTGLDIATSYGTPIKPIADGVVIFSGDKGSYGKLVIVSHGNGIESYYGHCSSLYVKEGDVVSTNTTIAAVGSTGNSTGNHLHLEIREDGIPLNPQNYLYK